ncbi:hypothetical protein ASZ78_013912 [Callipepla squamata]|uniref:TM2 domain-containing protein n=1 Tax=Callipepla squamata TaxID=9009 RepID=A0A226NG99_CALSU|nr:hypothetical protein ASZ78_013912 [Callipepla squamata]
MAARLPAGPGRRGRELEALCLLLLCFAAVDGAASPEPPPKCEELRLGQYPEHGAGAMGRGCPGKIPQYPVSYCLISKYFFFSSVQCLPAPNITCRDYLGIEKVFTGQEVGFYKPIECRNVNGYSYKVAVALSLFLGWLGADRFYLGYPALGLLKFCTVGFCGIGSLIDFILISMQIVGPSDGSSYIIDYYGARLTRLTITNATFRKMQTYP